MVSFVIEITMVFGLPHNCAKCCDIALTNETRELSTGMGTSYPQEMWIWSCGRFAANFGVQFGKSSPWEARCPPNHVDPAEWPWFS